MLIHYLPYRNVYRVPNADNRALSFDHLSFVESNDPMFDFARFIPNVVSKAQ